MSFGRWFKRQQCPKNEYRHKNINYCQRSRICRRSDSFAQQWQRKKKSVFFNAGKAESRSERLSSLSKHQRRKVLRAAMKTPDLGDASLSPAVSARWTLHFTHVCVLWFVCLQIQILWVLTVCYKCSITNIPSFCSIARLGLCWSR